VRDHVRLERDVVGHQIPRDARFIERDRTSHLRRSYTRVEGHLGIPSHFYSFIPRGRSDYDEGYWDGYGDGRRAGQHRHAHGAVVLSFYYGYYYSDPDWFGFSCPGYYPSAYHYLGYTPPWVYPARVYVSPSEFVYVPDLNPYGRDPERWRVDEAGARQAISDLERAWLDSDIDLVTRHLTDEMDVRVYFDGEYNYTTSTEDYYGMTADALTTTQTTSIRFGRPIFISSHEVFYTGRQEFYDPDGELQTTYLSYRLRQLGDEWYIVAIGTSPNPIEHKYHDFRDE
jgi:hypothetical protein